MTEVRENLIKATRLCVFKERGFLNLVLESLLAYKYTITSILKPLKYQARKLLEKNRPEFWVRPRLGRESVILSHLLERERQRKIVPSKSIPVF